MRQWYVSAFLLLAGSIFAVVLSNQPTGISAEKPDRRATVVRPKTEGVPKPDRRSHAKAIVVEPAIQRVADALFNAYKHGDAKEFAAIFTNDGEFIDAKGVIFHGRPSIENEFASLFKETPGATIEIELTSVRTLTPAVTAADCTTHFKPSATSAPIPGRCHIVLAREGDQWFVASLHESDVTNEASSHHAQVSQLEWMVGDWVGEGSHSQNHFSCRWDESNHFLLRQFTIHAAGKETLTGTQRIGYDPVAGNLRMWTFDSAGGFSDGYLHRDGDAWILRTSGVTAEGRIASSTNIFTHIDKSRISCETIDRMVGGERIVDSEKLTIIRKPSRQHERLDDGERRQN